ncbi:nucleotide exchange factor GrpE, partial [Fusobacterium gastrosuis]|nr:nucleotide exchange factor GrpE [Fusobacterium gastrosuis]
MQDNEIREEILEEKIDDNANVEIPEVEEIKEEVSNEIPKSENTDNEIEKLKAELEDWKQSYMRKQADFQNFSKRKEKELEELRKFSSEKIITKFLGSLDNLERAVEASSSTKDFDSLVKGVEMIIRNLQDIISSEGVEEIKSV